MILSSGNSSFPWCCHLPFVCVGMVVGVRTGQGNTRERTHMPSYLIYSVVFVCFAPIVQKSRFVCPELILNLFALTSVKHTYMCTQTWGWSDHRLHNFTSSLLPVPMCICYFAVIYTTKHVLYSLPHLSHVYFFCCLRQLEFQDTVKDEYEWMWSKPNNHSQLRFRNIFLLPSMLPS